MSEPMITDWISSISSLIYTGLTGVLVWVAWQANKTWKRELRENKRTELSRKFYSLLIDLESSLWLRNYELRDREDKILAKFKSLEQKLIELCFEYELLNNEEENIEYIDAFIILLNKYIMPEFIGDKPISIFANNIKKFIEDFDGGYSDDSDFICNSLEANGAFIQINFAKEHCKESLKDFYKP